MNITREDLAEAEVRIAKDIKEDIQASIGRWAFAIIGSVAIMAAGAALAWANTTNEIKNAATKDYVGRVEAELKLELEKVRSEQAVLANTTLLHSAQIRDLIKFKDDQLNFNIEQAKLILKAGK